MTIGGRDVAVWREDDLERRFVGRRGGAESIYDGRPCEDGNVVDGHDKGTDIC